MLGTEGACDGNRRPRFTWQLGGARRDDCASVSPGNDAAGLDAAAGGGTRRTRLHSPPERNVPLATFRMRSATT